MIKEQYKPGMRVRLLKMNDFQAPPIGTEGTVRGVDDIGSVMVAWDNGSGLNVVLDEDDIEILPAESKIKFRYKIKAKIIILNRVNLRSGLLF